MISEKDANHNHHDDEIDLLELWNTIWSQKFIIISITAIITSLAIAYALALPKVYQAEVKLLPPLSSDIQSIQLREVADLGIAIPSIDSLYANYLESLSVSEVMSRFVSHQTIKDFYQSEKNLTHEQLLNRVDHSLAINQPTEPKEKMLFISKEASITFQEQDPGFTVSALNTFIKTTGQYTNDQVRQSLKISINENLARLNSQIEVEDQRVNREINAEISRLEEQDEQNKFDLKQSFELENQRVNREINAEISRLEEQDEQNKFDLKQSFELENQRVNREINAEIVRLKEDDAEKKASLEEQIKLLREKAILDKAFKIARLRTDLNIAKALGIITPVNPADYNRQISNIARVDISNQSLSRYWLGTKALENEIIALETRESNDPFIGDLPELKRQLEALKVNQRIDRLQNRKDNFPFSEELRNIQAKLDKLNEPNIRIETLKNRKDNIPFSDQLRTLINHQSKLNAALKKVDSAQFKTYRLSREAITPEAPIKPNKKLIVAVAAVLGIMLGIFIALIRSALLKRRTLPLKTT